jgi:peptidoglycan/xylan/chitin deacetylase (PgdA/CDA1 family)
VTSPTDRKRVLVTTSWDDGHRLDPKLAALLDRYGIAGTFYIAPRNAEFAAGDRLSRHGVRELAERFEIGAHTLTHPRLPLIPADQARAEISGSKTEVEDITGTPITAFCYPRGEYTAEHVGMVRDAGFLLARTVRRHSLAPGAALQARTTVNAYAHRVDAAAVLRMAAGNPWCAARMFLHWDELAIAWFDKCLHDGGVFHLWGHSWEVDSRGDWQRLTRVLDYIGRRPGVEYVANGALVAGETGSERVGG